MLSMNTEGIINSLVEQLLCRNEGRLDAVALHFQLDCRMSYYADVLQPLRRSEHKASCMLHLLYHLPPHHAKVSVFSSVAAFGPTIPLKKLEWKHEVSHDSCWRNTRVFAGVYFDMAEKINAKLEKNGHMQVAPADMSEYNSFSIFHDVFRWLPCKVEIHKSDGCSYKRIITLI